MSFETDLYAVLSVDAGLVALVGDRIEPSHSGAPIPDVNGEIQPYVVYTPIFNEERYDLDGEGGLARVRLQVDCWAQHHDTAAEVARAVIAAIPVTGFPLHRTDHSNQDLGFEEGTRLYRRLIEFAVFHRST